MAIKYTLIEEPYGTDIHRFKLTDNSATIEVVETERSIYYNVIKEGKVDKDLNHRQFIVKYYEHDDGSDFGILVYRANELYLELTDGSVH